MINKLAATSASSSPNRTSSSQTRSQSAECHVIVMKIRNYCQQQKHTCHQLLPMKMPSAPTLKPRNGAALSGDLRSENVRFTVRVLSSAACGIAAAAARSQNRISHTTCCLPARGSRLYYSILNKLLRWAKRLIITTLTSFGANNCSTRLSHNSRILRIAAYSLAWSMGPAGTVCININCQISSVGGEYCSVCTVHVVRMANSTVPICVHSTGHLLNKTSELQVTKLLNAFGVTIHARVLHSADIVKI